MNLKIYLKSITLLVDNARDPGAPFQLYDLVEHLAAEAMRWGRQAKGLRELAETTTGWPQEVMLANAQRLEGYASHIGTEMKRLCDSLTEAETAAFRARFDQRHPDESCVWMFTGACTCGKMDFPRPFGALPYVPPGEN